MWVISGGFARTPPIRVRGYTLVHAEPRNRGGLKTVDDATQPFPDRWRAEIDQQPNLPVCELEIGQELLRSRDVIPGLESPASSAVLAAPREQKAQTTRRTSEEHHHLAAC